MTATYRWATYLITCVCCALLHGAARAQSGGAAAPLQIADQRQLFVDHYLIDQMQNLTLRLHHPEDRGEVLRFDQPWEGIFSGYFTVLHNGDRYQLYYRGMPDVDAMQVTCYAESADGIHWTRPNLGLHQINGSADNNIILVPIAPADNDSKDPMVTHNFSPMIDDKPGIPAEQRYKALTGNTGRELFAYVSPDGIHWKKLVDGAVIVYPQQPKAELDSREIVLHPSAFDSMNVPLWSPSERKYVAYARVGVIPPLPEGSTAKVRRYIRSIARATSDDFIHWSALEPMSYSDTETIVPSNHLYTNQTNVYFRAPQIYISTAARFMPSRQVISEADAERLHVNPKYFKDVSDIVLMTSRGGTRFDRTFLESFIRPGLGLMNWVSRTNYPARNIVQTSDTEMSLYVQKEYAQPTAHLERHVMRLDGLGSLHADAQVGEMLSKPIVCPGGVLSLNVSTSAAGSVQVAITDKSGNALPGYSFDDCPLIIGDQIERPVSWNDKAGLDELKGQTVRLRLRLIDADIYALKFDPQ